MTSINKSELSNVYSDIQTFQTTLISYMQRIEGLEKIVHDLFWNNDSLKNHLFSLRSGFVNAYEFIELLPPPSFEKAALSLDSQRKEYYEERASYIFENELRAFFSPSKEAVKKKGDEYTLAFQERIQRLETTVTQMYNTNQQLREKIQKTATRLFYSTPIQEQFAHIQEQFKPTASLEINPINITYIEKIKPVQPPQEAVLINIQIVDDDYQGPEKEKPSPGSNGLIEDYCPAN